MIDEHILVNNTCTTLLKKICSGALMSNNTSGCTGVRRKGNRWVAEITFQGVYHYLGMWATYDEAVYARHIAEKQYFGFA